MNLAVVSDCDGLRLRSYIYIEPWIEINLIRLIATQIKNCRGLLVKHHQFAKWYLSLGLRRSVPSCLRYR